MGRGGDVPATSVKVDMPPVKPANRADWKASWEQMKKRYPVGKEIAYLGVPMTVIYHREYVAAFRPQGMEVMPAIWPLIVAEYRDRNGIIQRREFGWEMMVFLLR